MNNNIINEFTKLISFVEYKIKELKKENNKRTQLIIFGLDN